MDVVGIPGDGKIVVRFHARKPSSLEKATLPDAACCGSGRQRARGDETGKGPNASSLKEPLPEIRVDRCEACSRHAFASPRLRTRPAGSVGVEPPFAPLPDKRSTYALLLHAPQGDEQARRRSVHPLTENLLQDEQRTALL